MPPVAKYALTYLFAQAEFGLLCPVNMTDSLTRTLKRYAISVPLRVSSTGSHRSISTRSRRAPCS